jgi:MFS family permease
MTAGPAPETGRRDYAVLFTAYAMALVGGGVAVVALTLLAYELAGDEAGGVIGTALAIKAATYVLVAPLAAAATARLSKRAVLIAVDLVRAGAILALPFVTALWQLYAAILVFTAASAVATPTYQAMVTRLLPADDDYRRAVAKSRIAGELEATVSPLLAAALLLALDVRGLFVAVTVVFLAAASTLWRMRLPLVGAEDAQPLWWRLRRGTALYRSVPALRFLVPLTLAVALCIALVMVKTVVIVQDGFGMGPQASAVALGVFGLGTLLGTLAMPRLVPRAGLRATILGGAALAAAGSLAAALPLGPAGLLALWAVIGLGAGTAMATAPLVLRRHGPEAEHGLLYAAQFSLANACLFVGYALAGALGEALGTAPAFLALGTAAALACAAAARSWSRAASPVPGA